MRPLVQFKEFTTAANSAPTTAQVPEPATLPTIEQLRHRLVSGNYADSVEVKVAIVGELTYLCFKELTKKRYL